MPLCYVLEAEHVVEGEAARFVVDAVEAEEAAGGVTDEDVAGLAGGIQVFVGEMGGGGDDGGAGAGNF